MPYLIAQQGTKHCVYKKGADGKKDGDSLGCHDSAKQAQAQIAAIYASEAVKEVMLAEAAKKGADGYLASLNQAVRGLWLGAFDRREFINAASTSIRQWLTRAWREGMSEAGIEGADVTDAEAKELARIITAEIGYLPDFAKAIQDGSKANGGKLDPLRQRGAGWASKYDYVKDRARLMANADQRLEWVYDPKKEHCKDCAKLNGRVKRASEWLKNDVLPRSRRLACFGLHCGCKLKPTKKPVSKGPLPRLSR